MPTEAINFSSHREAMNLFFISSCTMKLIALTFPLLFFIPSNTVNLIALTFPLVIKFKHTSVYLSNYHIIKKIRRLLLYPVLALKEDDYFVSMVCKNPINVINVYDLTFCRSFCWGVVGIRLYSNVNSYNYIIQKLLATISILILSHDKYLWSKVLPQFLLGSWYLFVSIAM